MKLIMSGLSYGTASQQLQPPPARVPRLLTNRPLPQKALKLPTRSLMRSSIWLLSNPCSRILDCYAISRLDPKTSVITREAGEGFIMGAAQRARGTTRSTLQGLQHRASNVHLLDSRSQLQAGVGQILRSMIRAPAPIRSQWQVISAAPGSALLPCSFMRCDYYLDFGRPRLHRLFGGALNGGPANRQCWRAAIESASSNASNQSNECFCPRGSERDRPKTDIARRRSSRPVSRR
jgi:hypothetical protein